MAFALQLEDSLDRRQSQVEEEFAAGLDLRTILTRHLLAVEDAAETQLRTSILLLDEDGRHLRHGAAPNLPEAYCEAIDGSEIGPAAGSCGTAAFCGHPIYVTDIATDPLWADYRDIALPHGLRACWSTPILDGKSVLGTFAIYHSTPRSPTPGEVQSIALITDRVAEAIKFDRKRSLRASANQPVVTIVLAEPANNLGEPRDLGQLIDRLDDCAGRLRSLGDSLESGDLVERVECVARDCEALVGFIRSRGVPLA